MFNPILVQDYLRQSAQRFADKNALICGEERWTYSELDSASSRLASFLLDIKVKRQDRVVVVLDNSAETVISLYGTLKAGAIFIILDGMIKAGKLRYILKDSGAAVLITQVNKSDVIQEALQDQTIDCSVIWVGEQATLLGDLPPSFFFWKQAVDPSLTSRKGDIGDGSRLSIDYDLAAIIYTSGSTGEPKGVMCAHFNMISVARSIIQYIGNNPDDVLLNVLPLSFGYGLYQVLTSVMVGGTVVLERSFAYPVKVLERLKKERATGFAMVPTIAALLLRIKNIDTYDLQSLRYITNAASALPVEHIRKIRSLLPHVQLFSMYGLTECTRVSYLPPGELDARPHSVGKAIPNCEIMVLDEDGQEVPPGKVGELVVRGANVMRGYWNSPELTSRTFRTGRYPGERLLYSGDLFKKDEEGFLFFVSRKDDIIKSKGEKISPREVENALCSMEGVAESAVIGIPDEILGQAVKALIVCNPGAALTERKVLKYCSENLQPLMMPKYVEFIDSLPKTPNGKIDKKILKSNYEKRITMP